MSSNQMDVSLLGKIAGYTEILAKDPHSTVFVPLCEAYRQMGLLDDALEIALKGTQALPRFSPGYTALGRIYAQRGDVDQAVSSFEKSLEMDAESLVALKGLARARMLKGEKELARPLLQRAASLKPDDAATQKMLASLGGEDVAPPPPPAAEASHAAGGEPVASPTLPSAGEGEPISTPTIAEIYIRQGFPQRALKVYRDLLQADPHNEGIRQKLVALKQEIDAEDSAERHEVPPGDTESAGQVQAVAVGDERSAILKYAQVLQLWLDAIDRRRAHVQ